MTCREKLKIEHPENVEEYWSGGCKGCPSDYGYLPGLSDYECEHISCRDCWDKEIPGTVTVASEILKNIYDILDEFLSGEEYEGKSVCELFVENNELKKQLAEKDQLINKLKRRIHRLEDEIDGYFDDQPMGGFKE